MISEVNPRTIDLDKALEMTRWIDWASIDKDEPKKLSFKSNHFPKIIDFNELEKIKAPKGFYSKLYSKDIRIEISSFKGLCPAASHYYCTIKFHALSLLKGKYTVFGATGTHEGRIFGNQTIDVFRPITKEDLSDKHSDWSNCKIGEMTHRWYNRKNAISCAKRIVKLRFKNYGKIIIEDCGER